MITKRMGLVVLLSLLACGKDDKPQVSKDCKLKTDAAYESWGRYIKALDKQQPPIAKKSAKFAPEGYDDLRKAGEEAIKEWEQAIDEAKQAATAARFGKRTGDRGAPTRAALEKAREAREKARIAIDKAFAARMQEGADTVQRDTEAVDAKGVSGGEKKKRIAKLEATQARVSKNNSVVLRVKEKLSRAAEELLDLAKQTAEVDEAMVSACAPQ